MLLLYQCVGNTIPWYAIERSYHIYVQCHVGSLKPWWEYLHQRNDKCYNPRLRLMYYWMLRLKSEWLQMLTMKIKHTSIRYKLAEFLHSIIIEKNNFVFSIPNLWFHMAKKSVESLRNEGNLSICLRCCTVHLQLK